jgi:hypothetical protein
MGTNEINQYLFEGIENIDDNDFLTDRKLLLVLQYGSNLHRHISIWWLL